MNRVAVGDHVIFVDARSVERNALVTAVWGDAEWEDGDHGPTINLVHVDGNEDANDSYGRQRVLPTSIVHEAGQPAPGMFWRLP